MKLLSRVGLTLLALVLVAQLPATALAVIHAVGQGEAHFAATGTLGMSIDGASHDLTVANDGTRVVVRARLSAFETGIGLRDRHMREYLDVTHFPNAELVLERQAIQLPASGSATRSVRGSLSLHGQTHPVDVRYTAQRNGSDTVVNASFRVNFTNYGVEVPSYLGVTVHPDVDVTVRITVRDE